MNRDLPLSEGLNVLAVFSNAFESLRGPIKNPLNGISSLLLTLSEFDLFRAVHALAVRRKAAPAFLPIETKG